MRHVEAQIRVGEPMRERRLAMRAVSELDRRRRDVQPRAEELPQACASNREPPSVTIKDETPRAVSFVVRQQRFSCLNFLLVSDQLSNHYLDCAVAVHHAGNPLRESASL